LSKTRAAFGCSIKKVQRMIETNISTSAEQGSVIVITIVQNEDSNAKDSKSSGNTKGDTSSQSGSGRKESHPLPAGEESNIPAGKGPKNKDQKNDKKGN